MSLIVLLLSSLPCDAAALNLIQMGFWTTGVDANNVAMNPDLNTGVVGGKPLDPHYSGVYYTSLTNPSGGQSFSVATTRPLDGVNFQWVPTADSSASRWITRANIASVGTGAIGTGAPGTYDYSLTVTTPAELTSVTGRWAADNDVEILINGNPTGVKRVRTGSPGSYITTFDTFEDFTVGGFNVGANTLTFRVKNGFAQGDNNTATGLRVEFLSSEAVPELSSVLLWIGLGGVRFVSKKRRKKA